MKPLRLCAFLALGLAARQPLAAQISPPSTGGAPALDRLLQQLRESRRVLMVAAHPDDEDNRLLSLLSQGYGADVAYLSLSRGEGGQNLIGPELGVDLGLLRSQELVSARAIDGARQFFTRAYDFGYSRSLEETEGFWLPDSILKDAVRVVRRFRPHVIVSIWSGTPRDRHGQHVMAGVIAHRAFDAAGNPASFPELESEEGLTAWRPLKLYRSSRFDTAATTLTLETGALDPRSGYSYEQIAMVSRSQHRSQAFGVLQPIGPSRTRLALVQDRTDGGPGAGIFQGIPENESPYARLADSLRRSVAPLRMIEAVPALAEALARGEEAGDVTAHERRLLGEALTVAAGIVIDARAGAAELVPGESVEIEVELYNAGGAVLTVQGITVTAPPGWKVDRLASQAEVLGPGADLKRRLVVEVPQEAQPTQPYFLARAIKGALYDWSEVAPELRGAPFDPPLLTATVELVLAGARFGISRPVTYRERDQVLGEVRRNVRVVPAIDVKIEPELVVWPADDRAPRQFSVSLTHNGTSPVSGVVELAGLTAPFRLGPKGASQSLQFSVPFPRSGASEIRLRAVARADDGRVFDRGVEVIDYAHVALTPRVRPAESRVHVVPLTLPRLRTVGYVRGASDRVPEALRRVGLPIELLDAEGLATSDLARFDAIVIGSRAYETDSALVNHNDRLLAYVENGGHLLVQYQQYQFVRGGYAPYPLRISFPHDRITDETAPVRVLEPDHPVFRVPHRIGESDWVGWPQERGLYFAGSWDDAYTPLLELSDPGMPPMRGGLLFAHYGSGTYVYTGLSFFRSLPAGVAGAYRLFLNLLALGER